MPWARVVEAAFELRRASPRFDLDSVVKTTGGKGLHIVMPFSPASRVSWDDAFAFSQAVSERLARGAAEGYVATMSKAKRTGKIFIDYFRNHRGSTAIAAYSTRARSGRAGRRPAGVGRADPRAESAQLHGRDGPGARGQAEGRPVVRRRSRPSSG